MLCTPRRKYRVSSRNREFFSRIWAPNEHAFQIGGLESLMDLDPKVHNKSVFHSDALFPKLEKYFTPTRWSPDPAHLQYAISVARKVFAPHQRYYPLEVKEKIKSSLKLDRNAGAPMFLSKGDSFEEDWVRAQKIASGELVPPPCVALKRTQHGEAGPKTRLVWGYPQAMTILEAKYAPVIIAAWQKHGVFRTVPYFARKCTLGANLIRFQNRPFRVQLDYSGFDSTVPRSLIFAAFDILRGYFHEVNEREWEAIVRYFVFTEIIMPDFHVYRKDRGIPSGSYFTQLVGSLVNFIAVVYAHRKAGVPLSPRNVMVMGDDSLVAPSVYVPISRLATILSDLNLKVNIEKSSVSRGSESIEFLGHLWPEGLPERELEELLKRIRFPERFGSLRQKPEERFAAFMADAVSTWRLWCKWTKRPTLEVIYHKFPVIRRSINVADETGLAKLLGPPSRVAFDLAVLGPLL